MNRDEPAVLTYEPEEIPGNLPVQIARLLGRGAALEQLRPLVWENRLLTLSGPGGVGKSRLACALAEAVREDFNAGAWWADIADTVDDGRVAQAVSGALLPGEPVGDPVSSLARRLEGPSLLVLDNCEQVTTGAARLVIDLLARAPGLRAIVTSRQSLGIPGEYVWRVPALSTDGAPEQGGAADRYGDGGSAAALFVARATECADGFDADGPGVEAAVVEICRMLDGLPLALELAAARVSVLSATQIAERLRDDTSLLRQTSRAAPVRHRTLRDTLDWSHQLLSASEQRLFARVAAFRGPFSLQAAEAVGTDDDLARAEIVDLLGALIDQSLVQVVESATLPRYRLLSTMRRYALSKLEESGELDRTLARHAAHYHALARPARAGLGGPEQLLWIQGLESDQENLADALERLFASEPADAAELALALWPLYYQRGWYDQARAWYERALDGNALPASLRLQTLLAAAEVAFLQCDYEVARGHLQRALDLSGDGADDPRAAATAHQRLGSIAREQGRYDEARALHDRALQLWAQLGDPDGVAASKSLLGFAAWLSGDFDGAERLCLDALAHFRAGGNLRQVSLTLVYLGAAALYRSEPDLAAQRLAEALAMSRRLGFAEGIAWSLHELAILAHRHRRPVGDPDAMLRDALLVHDQLGDRWRIASVLEEVAVASLSRRDPAAAGRLLGCAQALRDQIGTPVPPAEAPDLERALPRLRRQLAPAAFEQAWAEGGELDLQVVVAETIDALAERRTDVSGSELTPILTPRELAVLELLSAGQTNREIAATLYISPSTAGVHVSNILRKLQAKRRVDAAGRAHMLGLLPAA
ncbi:MAG: tetratricopeptide repeat protein [Solirubrobacteraceae bacterium]